MPIYRQFLTGSSTGSGTREFATWIANACALAAPALPPAAACQFPFLRMGTGNTWQRSAMTINHGAYYIDTTISRKTQMESRFNDPASGYFDCAIVPAGPCQPLSINSFVGGQTYNVYFVYAKGGTRQVYQIYVGEGFDPETAVQAIRVSLYTTPSIWPISRASSIPPTPMRMAR